MKGGVRTALSALNRRWWVAVVLVATLWVWQRYAVVQVGHNVAELRASIETLVETRDALLAENAALTARGRIESIASAHLGMEPTPMEHMVRVGEGLPERNTRFSDEYSGSRKGTGREGSGGVGGRPAADRTGQNGL